MKTRGTRNGGLPWTKGEIKQLKSMTKKKFKRKTIAYILRRTEMAVMKKQTAMGWRKPLYRRAKWVTITAVPTESAYTAGLTKGSNPILGSKEYKGKEIRVIKPKLQSKINKQGIRETWDPITEMVTVGGSGQYKDPDWKQDDGLDIDDAEVGSPHAILITDEPAGDEFPQSIDDDTLTGGDGI